MRKSVFIVICLTIILLTACKKEYTSDNITAGNETVSDGIIRDEDGYIRLSFKDTVSVEELKKYDGQEVAINGYLATSSPANGSFIFLMNLPYQSCPFCLPNTSELANTLEVYPKNGETFGFTTQAVRVTGTLEFCQNGYFTDEYGYEFGYKISDGEYTIITDTDMNGYQRIADSGLIDKLYGMYDYAYLMTGWTDYFCSPFTDEDGNFWEGYYMFPDDVPYIVENQYGINKDTFFNDLYQLVNSLNTDGSLDTIKNNIYAVEELIGKGYEALDNKEFTYEQKYWEDIQNEDVKYTLNNGSQMTAECEELYMEFCQWINSFEI